MSLLDSPRSFVRPSAFACYATATQPRLPQHCREAVARRALPSARAKARLAPTPQQGKRAPRRRLAPTHDHEVWDCLTSEVGSQALTINHVSAEQGCLTPAFSGAA